MAMMISWVMPVNPSHPYLENDPAPSFAPTICAFHLGFSLVGTLPGLWHRAGHGLHPRQNVSGVLPAPGVQRLGRGGLRDCGGPLEPPMTGRGGAAGRGGQRQGAAGNSRRGVARSASGGRLRPRQRPGAGTKGGSGANARRVNWGWPPACWPSWSSRARWLPGTPSTPSGS